MKHLIMLFSVFIIACSPNTDNETIENPGENPSKPIGLIRAVTYTSPEFGKPDLPKYAFTYKETIELAYNHEILVHNITSNRSYTDTYVVIGNENIFIKGVIDDLEVRYLEYNKEKMLRQVTRTNKSDSITQYFIYDSHKRLQSIAENSKTTYLGYNTLNQVDDVLIQFKEVHKPDFKQKLFYDKDNNLAQLTFGNDGETQYNIYFTYSKSAHPFKNSNINLQFYHPAATLFPSILHNFEELYSNFEYFYKGTHALASIRFRLDNPSPFTEYTDYTFNLDKITSVQRNDLDYFLHYLIGYTYY